MCHRIHSVPAAAAAASMAAEVGPSPSPPRHQRQVALGAPSAVESSTLATKLPPYRSPRRALQAGGLEQTLTAREADVGVGAVRDDQSRYRRI